MNALEDPQSILWILGQIESSIQEDIYIWKAEMAGEFANSYIKVREDQLEMVKNLQKMWLGLNTNKFN